MQPVQPIYFDKFPKEFADSADVVLSAGGRDFPVHSQFLSSQSRFFSKMLRDLGHSTFSPVQQQLGIPLEGVEQISTENMEAFLRQLYSFGNLPMQTAKEAYQLLQLADMFDAPKLLSVCYSFLENPDHVLKQDKGKARIESTR